MPLVAFARAAAPLRSRGRPVRASVRSTVRSTAAAFLLAVLYAVLLAAVTGATEIAPATPGIPCNLVLGSEVVISGPLTTTNPYGGCILDANVDGFLDAGVLATSYGVFVAINHGSSWVPPVYVGPTSSSHTLSCGRINNDTLPDMVWAVYHQGVTVALNLFNGTKDVSFSVSTFFGANGAWATDIADMDNDGNVDIITGSWNLPPPSGGFYIFYSTGGASPNFTVTTNYRINDTYIHWIRAGRLDGDAYPDIIFSRFQAHVFTVMTNLGGRTGFNLQLQETVTNSASCEFADFNNDGLLDVLHGGKGLNGQLIRYNLGGGVLAPSIVVTNSFSVLFTLTGYPADLNGDGFLDVLVISEHVSGGGVYWAANDGFGNFVTPWVQIDRLGQHGWTVEVADFNLDGIPDVLYSELDFNQVYVYSGSCQAKTCPLPYAAVPVPAVSAAGMTALVSLKAMDGDTTEDLATLDAGTLKVYRCAGQLPPTQMFSLGAAGAVLLATGDLMARGLPDLIVATAGGTLTVMLHTGTTAAPYSAFLTPFASAIGAMVALETGRCDAGPTADVVAATGDSIVLFLSNGAGGFAAPISLVVSDSGSGAPVLALAVGDTTGDGVSDFAFSNSTGVYSLRNSGTGSFAALTAVPFLTFNYTNITRPPPVTALTLSDLDVSGSADLVAANNASVFTVVNLDGGLFVARTLFAGTTTYPSAQSLHNPFAGTRAVRTGDLNRDGAPDVIAVGVSFAVVYLSTNPAGFQFRTLELIFTQPPPGPLLRRFLAVGDWNGDAVPDIATGGIGGAWLHYTLCRTAVAPATATAASACDGPATGTIGDLTVPFGASNITGIAAIGRGPKVVSTFANGLLAVTTNMTKTAAISTSVIWIGLSAPVLFDRDGDGYPEAWMVAAGNASVLWVRGTAAGLDAAMGWGVVVAFTAGVEPLAVDAADFDADGTGDALVGSSFGMTAFRGNFGFFSALDFLNVVGPCVAVQFFDANQDGRPDAVGACAGGVTLVYNGVLFGFQAPVLMTVLSPVVASSLARADINGDGWDDLIFAATAIAATDVRLAWLPSGLQSTPPQPTVLLKGAVAPLGGGVMAALTGPTLVRAGDLDNDGDTDIVLSNRGSGALGSGGVWLLANRGGGGFMGPSPISQVADVRSMALADADSDGRLDIVLARASNTALADVILNSAPAVEFARPVTISTSLAGFGGGTGPAQGVNVIVPFDVDGDGDVDVVWGSMLAVGFGFLENVDGLGTVWANRWGRTGNWVNSLSVADLDGLPGGEVATCTYADSPNVVQIYGRPAGGVFSGPWNVLAAATLPDNCERLRTVDLDRSGGLDIALALKPGPIGIRLYMNPRNATTGQLNLTGPVDITSVSNLNELLFADLSTTGWGLDFAITAGADAISFIALSPSLVPGVPTVFTYAGAIPWLGVVNWNGDRYPDIVAVSNSVTPAFATVFLNTRSAPWIVRSSNFTATVPSNNWEASASDLTGDGLDDLVFAIRTLGDLYLWRSNGAAAPLPPVKIEFIPAASLTTMALADVNGDGLLDVLVASDNKPQHVLMMLQLNHGRMLPSLVPSIAVGAPPVSALAVAAPVCGFTVQCLLSMMLGAVRPVGQPIPTSGLQSLCVASAAPTVIPAGTYTGCLPAPQLLTGLALTLGPHVSTGPRIVINCTADGGYVFALGAATALTLVNVTIIGTGPAAPAIAVSGAGAVLTLRGVEVIGAMGGGVAVTGAGASVLASRTAIRDCRSTASGGGLLVSGSGARAVLSGGCTFHRCVSLAGPSGGGGGIAVLGPATSLLLTGVGSTVAFCSAPNGLGGGLLIANGAIATVQNTHLLNNTAVHGGSFAAVASTASPFLPGPRAAAASLCPLSPTRLSLSASVVNGSTALTGGGGGGLICGVPTDMSRGVVFTGNAALRGGGLFFCNPGADTTISACLGGGGVDCCNPMAETSSARGAPWLASDFGNYFGQMDGFSAAPIGDAMARVPAFALPITGDVGGRTAVAINAAMYSWFGTVVRPFTLHGVPPFAIEMVLSVAAANASALVVNGTAGSTWRTLLNDAGPASQTGTLSTTLNFTLADPAAQSLPVEIHFSLAVTATPTGVSFLVPVSLCTLGSTVDTTVVPNVRACLTATTPAPAPATPSSAAELAAATNIKSPSSTLSLLIYLTVGLLIWLVIGGLMVRRKMQAKYAAAPHLWRKIDLADAVLGSHPVIGIINWSRDDPFTRAGRTLALCLMVNNVFAVAAILDLRAKQTDSSSSSFAHFNLAKFLNSVVIAALGTLLGAVTGIPLIRMGLHSRSARTRLVTMVVGCLTVVFFVALNALLVQLRVWIYGGAARPTLLLGYTAFSVALNLFLVSPLQSVLAFAVFGMNHVARQGTPDGAKVAPAAAAEEGSAHESKGAAAATAAATAAVVVGSTAGDREPEREQSVSSRSGDASIELSGGPASATKPAGARASRSGVGKAKGKGTVPAGAAASGPASAPGSTAGSTASGTPNSSVPAMASTAPAVAAPAAKGSGLSAEVVERIQSAPSGQPRPAQPPRRR